jgi:hypothetical protein
MMKPDSKASDDFERAFWKGFWRKVVSHITGQKIELLPFGEAREHVPLRGQHYIGLRQVPIDQIVGSMGRYRDFDRAFLPGKKRAKDRWMSIDKAHHQEINLPPVELYKTGQVYSVFRRMCKRISGKRSRSN